MIPAEVISYILETFAGFGGVSLVILLLWIFFPDKVEKWAISFHKLLAFLSERHERRYIAKHIETKINDNNTRLCKECQGAIPYKIKVQWVDVENVESELRDGTFIVKMKNHRNQSKNLAYAVKEYIPNTLIPRARVYVEPLLMRGVDYVISKSILSGDPRALSYFNEAIGDFLEEPQTKNIIKELEHVHSQGRMTRILLTEYSSLASLYPVEPDDEIHQETVDFEKKLYEISSKEPEENVDARFVREHIRSAIVLVAKPLTILTKGIEPHMSYIEKSIEKGTDKIYICAVGMNIPYAKKLCKKAIREFGLEKIAEDEYEGLFRQKRRQMYCSCLVRKS